MRPIITCALHNLNLIGFTGLMNILKINIKVQQYIKLAGFQYFLIISSHIYIYENDNIKYIFFLKNMIRVLRLVAVLLISIDPPIKRINKKEYFSYCTYKYKENGVIFSKNK